MYVGTLLIQRLGNAWVIKYTFYMQGKQLFLGVNSLDSDKLITKYRNS